MSSKELGSLLLILGTSIGGGMLALPAVTASLNFSAIALYLLLAWALMSLGALAMVSVQIRFQNDIGFMPLARKTVGRLMSTVTLLFSLLLLYSLLCAYTVATGDVLHTILNYLHIIIPKPIALLLTALLLSSIVYRGIGSVDRLNRIFMFIKIASCFLLIGSILPSDHWPNLRLGQNVYTGHGFLVMITSFGYGTILPSIGEYLQFDRKRLFRVSILGGLIPLVLYLIWVASVHAALTPEQLLTLMASDNTTETLLQQLITITAKPVLQSFAWTFSAICTFTAFLGVSISLLDFLSGALKIPRTKQPKLALMALTYVPPTLIAMLAPWLFVQALAYAGVCCVFLLILLPLWMWIKCKI
ncbi:MAG: tryptophan/tyrosine permease [Gammaproteobacteria bacterium]|jgi:tyrosine-specific transport protein|nr:tryptophan/tyrosine permease [Gammaproteobacteria bacterium]